MTASIVDFMRLITAVCVVAGEELNLVNMEQSSDLLLH